MFSSISWETYFTIVATILTFYYLVVALAFYGREILQKAKGKQNPNSVINNPEDDINELEQAVHDINGILKKANNPPCRGDIGGLKSELLQQLKGRLANFSGLRNSAYRVAIINHIIKYSKTFCGVTFSEEELEAIFPKEKGR